MALNVKMQYAGRQAETSYVLVDRVKLDKISGRVTFHLVGYVSEAARRAASAVHADLAERERKVEAARGAYAIAHRGKVAAASANASQDEVDSADVAELEAQTTLRKAETDFRIALAKSQAVEFAPVFESPEFQLSPAAAETAVKDGKVDLAALYAIAKSKIGMLKDASDV